MSQQLKGGQAREPSAVEHKVVNPELDERPHLLDHLLRCAHEAKVLVGILSAVEPAGERLGLFLSGCAGAAAAPRSPHAGCVAADSGAGPLELPGHAPIAIDTARR